MKSSRLTTFNWAMRLAGQRLDRDRHVLDVLFAALRGDHDFSERRPELSPVASAAMAADAPWMPRMEQIA